MDEDNRRTLDTIRIPPLVLPNHQRAVDFVKVHFSLSDWVFDTPNIWRLNPTYFISTPTSLEGGKPGGASQRDYMFLGTALGACIAEGRVINNVRTTTWDTMVHDLCFRAQGYPTNGLPTNCYWLDLDSGGWNLWKRTAGVNASLGGAEPGNVFPANTWKAYRFTWYNYISPTFTLYLRTIFETWEAGAWSVRFTIDDASPSWGDSAINKVGFSKWNTSQIVSTCMDDTQIWRKAL